MSDNPIVRKLSDRLNKIEEALRRLQNVSVRSEITGAFGRLEFSDLPSDFIAGRQWFVTDQLDGMNFTDDGTAQWGQYQLKSYTVATLPTATPDHTIAFATNGRRAGEASGLGTGVPVWFDGTVWRTFYDNTQVLA